MRQKWTHSFNCVVLENIHTPSPRRATELHRGGGGWSKRRQFPIDLKAISYFTVNRCFKAKIIVVIDDLLFAVGWVLLSRVALDCRRHMNKLPVFYMLLSYTTGNFRVPPGLRLKTRLSAQPLIWKWFFILMQIKLISTRKVVHLASFWKRGFLELGSGLLDCGIQCNVVTPSCFNKPSSNVLLTERNRRYWSSLVWEMTSLVSGACVVYGRTTSMVLRLNVKN